MVTVKYVSHISSNHNYVYEKDVYHDAHFRFEDGALVVLTKGILNPIAVYAPGVWKVVTLS